MQILRLMPLILFVILLTLAGCGDNGPTGPEDEEVAFTATVNGQPFIADRAEAYISGEVLPSLIITGYQTEATRAIEIILNEPSEGNFNVGDDTGGVLGGVSMGYITDLQTLAGYYTDVIGSGSLTITSLTDDRAAGTFHFSAESSDGEVQVTDGSFDVALQEE